MKRGWQECGEHEFKLFSPADAKDRGSQINLCHPEGYAIIQVSLSNSLSPWQFVNLEMGRGGLETALKELLVGLRDLNSSNSWICGSSRCTLCQLVMMSCVTLPSIGRYRLC